MYEYLLIAHNWLRWIILILLIVNIARHLGSPNKPWTKTDNSLGLILMICAHITLLIGLYQWFFGNLGIKLFQQYGGAVMKDNAMRFWAVEHITGMLIAIILITIGKGVGRKAIPNAVKHKRALALFSIALVVILLAAPWPFRDVVGRPWLRTA